MSRFNVVLLGLLVIPASLFGMREDSRIPEHPHFFCKDLQGPLLFLMHVNSDQDTTGLDNAVAKNNILQRNCDWYAQKWETFVGYTQEWNMRDKKYTHIAPRACLESPSVCRFYAEFFPRKCYYCLEQKKLYTFFELYYFEGKYVEDGNKQFEFKHDECCDCYDHDFFGKLNNTVIIASDNGQCITKADLMLLSERGRRAAKSLHPNNRGVLIPAEIVSDVHNLPESYKRKVGLDRIITYPKSCRITHLQKEYLFEQVTEEPLFAQEERQMIKAKEAQEKAAKEMQEKIIREEVKPEIREKEAQEKKLIKDSWNDALVRDVEEREQIRFEQLSIELPNKLRLAEKLRNFEYYPRPIQKQKSLALLEEIRFERLPRELLNNSLNSLKKLRNLE